MDLVKMFGFGDPKERDIPPIWKEIQDIWDDFHKKPSRFEEWESLEDLDGLITGITPENIQMIYDLKGHEIWRLFPPEVATFVVTAFTAGIRAGNELNKRRN